MDGRKMGNSLVWSSVHDLIFYSLSSEGNWIRSKLPPLSLYSCHFLLLPGSLHIPSLIFSEAALETLGVVAVTPQIFSLCPPPPPPIYNGIIIIITTITYLQWHHHHHHHHHLPTVQHWDVTAENISLLNSTLAVDIELKACPQSIGASP